MEKKGPEAPKRLSFQQREKALPLKPELKKKKTLAGKRTGHKKRSFFQEGEKKGRRAVVKGKTEGGKKGIILGPAK